MSLLVDATLFATQLLLENAQNRAPVTISMTNSPRTEWYLRHEPLMEPIAPITPDFKNYLGRSVTTQSLQDSFTVLVTLSDKKLNEFIAERLWRRLPSCLFEGKQGGETLSLSLGGRDVEILLTDEFCASFEQFKRDLAIHSESNRGFSIQNSLYDLTLEKDPRRIEVISAGDFDQSPLRKKYANVFKTNSLQQLLEFSKTATLGEVSLCRGTATETEDELLAHFEALGVSDKKDIFYCLDHHTGHLLISNNATERAPRRIGVCRLPESLFPLPSPKFEGKTCADRVIKASLVSLEQGLVTISLKIKKGVL